jgi:hypothetical protein
MNFSSAEIWLSVGAAFPHVELTFEAEGEATVDKLHGFFKRDVRSGRDQRMKMIGHQNEGMQEELPLFTVVEDGFLQQFGRGRDLEEAVALRGHGGHEVGSGFLGRHPHLDRIDEVPVAKATVVASGIQGPEGPLPSVLFESRSASGVTASGSGLR